MKPPAKNWKSIVLTQGRWPANLVVPQRGNIPSGSRSLLGLCDATESWDYELLRAPNGRSYYLRVWARNYPGKKFDEDPKAPAARLTPEEAFRFAVANLVPEEMLADCASQAAKLLKT